MKFHVYLPTGFDPVHVDAETGEIVDGRLYFYNDNEEVVATFIAFHGWQEIKT